MPVAGNPKAAFEISPLSSVDVPAESRPTLVCRFLAMRQTNEYRDALNAIDAIEDPKAKYKRLIELLELFVREWRNLTKPDGTPIGSLFDLDEALTDAEIVEIALRIPGRQREGYYEYVATLTTPAEKAEK